MEVFTHEGSSLEHDIPYGIAAHTSDSEDMATAVLEAQATRLPDQRNGRSVTVEVTVGTKRDPSQVRGTGKRWLLSKKGVLQ